MGSLSVWHWLIVVIFFASCVIPQWKIVSKAGYSGALSLLLFIPILNVLLIWIFAFSKWPALSGKAVDKV